MIHEQVFSDAFPSNEKEKIKTIKAIRSDELSKLSNEQIALRLYFLIANGAEKDVNDYIEIGKHLHGLSIQIAK